MNPTNPLRLEPLTNKSLKLFRDLLGSSDFGGCFCAVWTSYGQDWTKRCNDPAQPNYFTTERLVNQGHHVGYLVFDNDELVGWTGSGPKTAFPQLETKLGSRLSSFSPKTWSVGCLAVPETHRGKKLSERIVAALILEARIHNSEVVEAYPIRPFHEPRIFRGTHSLYQRMGFEEVGSEKDGEFDIVLMRLPFPPDSSDESSSKEWS